MCDACDLRDTIAIRFYGGPVDGTEIPVPRKLQRVQVPTLTPAGYVQAIYTRHELTTGPAMVCEGAWPLCLARE